MPLNKPTMVLLALLTTAGNLSAHTLTTATGVAVSHGHYSTCGPNGCPASDSSFEASAGFSSADRVYSGTGAWNCHGRTFDARRSWVSYAEPWLQYDDPVYTSFPISGDAVIWWSGSTTSHSVTLLSTWNSTSTPVMSKYGTQGQYRHALYNPIALYGSDWSAVYFNAGTAIYSGVQAAGAGARTGPKVDKKDDTEKERNEIRKGMPWYEDVLASQVIYEVEHPRLVAKSAHLSETARVGLGEAKGDQARLAILISDITDPTHFGILNAYNSPAFSEDFITEIEAGKLLVKIVKKRPELKDEIVDLLSKLITETEGGFKDQLRGAGIHFLTQILSKSERVATKKELRRMFPEQRGETPTYTDHYLNKM